MRTYLKAVALCSLAGILLTSFTAYTQNDNSTKPDKRTISVTGEAEIQVVPDEVNIKLGIETSNEILENAKATNDESIAKVIQALKELGIEDEYIQTPFYQIEPRYKYIEGDKKRVISSYNIRKGISVTLKKIELLSALLDDVVIAGCNNIIEVKFRTTDLRKYRDEARQMAIKAAKEKALALTGELDMKLGKPISIDESSMPYYGWYYDSYNSWWYSWGGYDNRSMSQNVSTSYSEGSSNTGDNTAPGKISIKASVRVVFEMK